MPGTMPGVPEGHHTVCPYLVVRDADQILEFMKQAFGARERGVHRTPEGRVMHAEVGIGDSVVMLGEANENWNGFRAMIHLYVPDVDKVFQRAVEAGGSVIREVADQDYGDRSGGVEDAAGNQWWIATHLAESSEDSHG